MKINKKSLQNKGWSKEEIEHTDKILRRLRKKKKTSQKLFNHLVYWGTLIIAILTIIAISIWIIPLFVLAKGIVMYPILIILALGFGMIFMTLIKELDHLKLHHHLIISSALPLTGITTFITVISQINKVVPEGVNYNSFLVGALFTLFFLLPYFHTLIIGEKL